VIVGVVRDAKYNNVRETPPATVYVPLRAGRSATLEVRTAGDPLPLIAGLRAEIERANPSFQVTGAMLQRQGATVLLAANGSQALELYRQSRDQISLILLDLTMPGLSGVEVLRQLRQLDAQQKIVVMSGYSEEDIMEQLRESPPTAIIKKPYRSRELVLLMKKVLGGN